MPKTTLERNSFVRGLITEASPLTFPENASLDEDNFILNRDGSRQRRFGLDYEGSYALTAISAANFGGVEVGTYTWKNADNNPDLTIGVVQIGNVLHFLDLTASAPSAATIPTLTLASTYETSLLQYTPIKGVLVCVGSAGDAFYISRTNATTYTKTDIDLKVRDIWGVEESPALAVDERPATLSTTHNYNLLNQGWDSSKWGPSGGVYVSNADVMQYGKNATDDFSRTFLNKQFFGNTPAPKGRYIIDAFTRGASRVTESSVSGLTTDVEAGRCSTAATYAGRIFYSGVDSSVSSGDSNSPSYSGTIFFSRIIDALDKLGQCYQEADPTSEHIADLIATDGGTIDIPEATSIYKLIPNQTSLVVIAKNGVWEISGPDGVFAADDFSISQVSNVGALNAESIISAEGRIMYWSEGGIYVLAPNDVTGRLAASNLTETTIQTFYTDIPSVAKEHVTATYDVGSRKIRWLYNDSSTYDGITLKYKYNRELIFDTVLQAFYTNTIGELATNSPFVAGFMELDSFLTGDVVTGIVVNGDQVQVGGDDVQATIEGRLAAISKTKYLAVKPGSPYSFTLGFYNNTNFKDWEADDSTGVDAPAYLVTGYELWNDTQRDKWVPYVTTHMKFTGTGFTDVSGNLTPVGDSGCKMQAQWDWADSANSGKWGSEIQIYRLTRSYMPSGAGDTFDYGQVVVSTKSRLRGSGKALSLKFTTEALKDCILYGWGMDVGGAGSV